MTWQDYIEIIELLWPSLLTAAAVAIAASVAGVFVLLRRDALLALAVPQAVGAGAALGMRLEWPTLPPALGVVGLTMGALSWTRQRRGGYLLLPAIYIAGLCIAFLLIANSGQHVADLQNLFTGMDVAVTESHARIVAPVLVAFALVIALLWRRWLLLAQSPAIAQLARLHPAWWQALFLVLMAAIIILGTNALGSVLVLVMLFLPAGTVLPWTRRVPAAMIGATVFAVLFLIGGFYFSINEAWPMSQSIGGVGFAVFCASNTVATIRG